MHTLTGLCLPPQCEYHQIQQYRNDNITIAVASAVCRTASIYNNHAWLTPAKSSVVDGGHAVTIDPFVIGANVKVSESCGCDNVGLAVRNRRFCDDTLLFQYMPPGKISGRG
eukprot:scaffold643932_cov18-Prasinocladus_malaysianus.AAC.1